MALFDILTKVWETEQHAYVLKVTFCYLENILFYLHTILLLYFILPKYSKYIRAPGHVIFLC